MLINLVTTRLCCWCVGEGAGLCAHGDRTGSAATGAGPGLGRSPECGAILQGHPAVSCVTNEGMITLSIFRTLNDPSGTSSDTGQYSICGSEQSLDCVAQGPDVMFKHGRKLLM